VIRQWIAEDPSWVALTWLEPDPYPRPELPPELFAPGERARLYARAAEEKHLPDEVYFFLGDKLRALGRDDAAERAYANVLVSREPRSLFQLGERFQDLGRWEKSLEAFERARKLDGERKFHHDDVYRRAIGRALWKIGDYRLAVREFATTKGSEALGDDWRTSLVAELLDDKSVETLDRYRLLKRWLGRQLTAAHLAEQAGARHDAAEAILLLTSQRYQQLVRRRDDDQTDDEGKIPRATPLVLEADGRFFPEGAQTAEVQRMLDSDIPALRLAVAETWGWPLPGVRIVPSLEETWSYRVGIDEVPFAGSAFGEDQVTFVVDRALAEAQGLSGTPGIDPITQREGLWLAAEEAPPELEAWDRYAYMLRHLQATVAAHLERLVGAQEVRNVLDVWASEEPSAERGSLVERALADERTRLRLVAVARSLAAEQVPFLEVSTILSAFTKADPDADLHDVVESVRAALHPGLPGCQENGRIRTLPPDVEDRIASWVRGQAGKRFLAAPPAEIDNLRRTIRERLAEDDQSPVVVLTPRLRPFVRRIVALDYPLVPVVARSELPDLRLPMTVPRIPRQLAGMPR
jgi:tetratricopeptide (TPR) repeat protein